MTIGLIFASENKAGLRPLPINDKPVLAIFSSKYCGPCRKLKSDSLPYVQDVLDKYTVVYIDGGTEEGKKYMQEWGIRYVPTLVICTRHPSGCKTVARRVGFVNKEKLREWLENNLKKIADSP
jgi:thioredoxin-like negative regulator of GroEL